MLSFDEWNVWYRTRRRPEDRTRPGRPVAPPLLEEAYTLKDALAVGGCCLALLNHADRVKVACLAQLVNVIAPIMTATGGPAWRQTIFYPFAHFSNFGRGRVLRAKVDGPTYAASCYDPRGAAEHRFALPAVPYLKLAAVHDEHAGSLTLFALNRSLDEALPLEVTTDGFAGLALAQALTLHDRDLDAANTADAPERVTPVSLDGVVVGRERLHAELPPASWSVIRLAPA
jgi:alpha-N-arabinofuranosidase